MDPQTHLLSSILEEMKKTNLLIQEQNVSLKKQIEVLQEIYGVNSNSVELFRIVTNKTQGKIRVSKY
jgi:hypothetical protein